MKWEHINFLQRKAIVSGLAQHKSLKEIAEITELDPTSISKEIVRNRSKVRQGKIKNKVCKKILRFPRCCNGCSKRYSECLLDIYEYKAEIAQEKADRRLVNSRTGINITEEEFDEVDKIIKEGIANKQSIYHISKSNEGMPSTPTLYRWIREKKLTTTWMDLPYAKTYKKRKRNEKYAYSNNKIDRSGRTFVDYLEHRRHFPGEYTVQMDFLGSIISDSKCILTLTIPELHFVIIKLFDSPNSEKVVSMFNEFEERLGIHDFNLVFPSILTDRDPCFADFIGIEFSHLTGEQRSKVFYCDSYRSSQKGNVENMNKQLRKYFPKGKSVDYLTDEDIAAANNIIISQKIASLGGLSPKEVFESIYGSKLLYLLLKTK